MNADWLQKLRRPLGAIRRRVKIAMGKGRQASDRMAATDAALTARLRWFLTLKRRLVLPRTDDPEVSLVVGISGNPARLLACLRSLREIREVRIEVILVKPSYESQIRALSSLVDGATVVSDDRKAIEQAKGKYVGFLGPAYRLGSEALTSALETIRRRPGVGLVVGMSLGVDGVLEEAGSIEWPDGLTSAYGQGLKADDPLVMFEREVDFCSGGFALATRLACDAWADPAAWSARLRDQGLKTVYDPRVRVHRLDRRNRETIPSDQPSRSGRELLIARNRSASIRKVLQIDDLIPYQSLGAGFPRTQRIVADLARSGVFLTYYPMFGGRQSWPDVRACIDQRVEVMTDHSFRNLAEFLQARAGYYDVILVSRPDNMKAVRPLTPTAGTFGRPRVIYDAEALFSGREIAKRRLSGDPLPLEEERAMIEGEVSLADGADTIVSVSDAEAKKFSDHGFREVYTLGHCVEVEPCPQPFEDRAGLLFVGAIHAEGSPNADSMTWFLGQVWPKLRTLAGPSLEFQLAGLVQVPEITAMWAPGVRFLGRVEDLTSLYQSARVFVAPTRFAAGIPLKCVEAAAFGLPMVTTSLLAEQLGWQEGVELLVADDPQGFAAQCDRLNRDPVLWRKLRQGALNRIAMSYSPQGFRATLARIIG